MSKVDEVISEIVDEMYPYFDQAHDKDESDEMCEELSNKLEVLVKEARKEKELEMTT